MSPFIFLIEAFFNFYIMAIMLRFLMQFFRADFYNPFSQFVVKITNPVLKPLRRIIPSIGGIDTSSIVLTLVVCALKILLLYGNISASGLIILSIRELVVTAIYLFIGMILIRIIISWVSPGINNPIVSVLYQVSEPLMARVRRIIPPFGGLDLSTIILLLGLQFLLRALDSWIFSPILQML